MGVAERPLQDTRGATPCLCSRSAYGSDSLAPEQGLILPWPTHRDTRDQEKPLFQGSVGWFFLCRRHVDTYLDVEMSFSFMCRQEDQRLLLHFNFSNGVHVVGSL